MKLFIRIYYMSLKLIFSEERYATNINPGLARKAGVKVGEGCRLYSSNFGSEPFLIEIGEHVTITAGVQFITHDGGVWVLRGLDSQFQKCDLFGKIVIGNNVFIGINSIIMPGVTIGDNCIIASGSVVTRSFESNSVIAGLPAKSIKSIEEYQSDVIPFLLDTKGLSPIKKKQFIMEKIRSIHLRVR
jgi:acetyltransferase-like isoleucine patch superfamily enzyme